MIKPRPFSLTEYFEDFDPFAECIDDTAPPWKDLIEAGVPYCTLKGPRDARFWKRFAQPRWQFDDAPKEGNLDV